jgi:hypothetical protein
MSSSPIGTGAGAIGGTQSRLCAQPQALLDEARSATAAIRIGAEPLTRSDLFAAQTQRLARHVLAATTRLEQILSDLAQQVSGASSGH